ncbi:LOW QUALITY PROTEIN: hypothetical protein PHMEG_00027786 [Phytophthora megakarya]|uniref:Uncharacterized protein n=1 Tax=Phytophthora megakarya TaxID=4795 RepID=A0A225V6F1_9STRA|nr:LOW QUALITY PROTEIN: hypothetical protein PHMEG_00027786 [Phytophthora megakarya]
MLEVEAASLQVAVMPTDAAPATGTRALVSVANSKHSGRTSDVKRGEDGVQVYVNRILKHVAEPAGATTDLTLHSFRRGGDSKPAWMFDLGAWDMTKTNKALAYITNTAREGRKVARVLSGWGADEMPSSMSRHSTTAAKGRLCQMQALLFSSCMGLKQQNRNVSTKVLNVLLAYPIRHYPPMEGLAPASPIITPVEDCLEVVEIPFSDVVAWFVALNNIAAPPVEKKSKQEIEATTTLAARLTIVEAAQMKSNKRQAYAEAKEADRKKQARNLSVTWSEWYTSVPRVWIATDRQKKSESRHIVAFMNLFLTEGFVLDDKAADYKDQVLHADRRAEDAVLAFLKTHNSRTKGTGSGLRVLRPLHKSRALEPHIVAYRHLLAIRRIQDPAPVETQDILAIVGHV